MGGGEQGVEGLGEEEAAVLVVGEGLAELVDVLGVLGGVGAGVREEGLAVGEAQEDGG